MSHQAHRKGESPTSSGGAARKKRRSLADGPAVRRALEMAAAESKDSGGWKLLEAPVSPKKLSEHPGVDSTQPEPNWKVVAVAEESDKSPLPGSGEFPAAQAAAKPKHAGTVKASRVNRAGAREAGTQRRSRRPRVELGARPGERASPTTKLSQGVERGDPPAKAAPQAERSLGMDAFADAGMTSPAAIAERKAKAQHKAHRSATPAPGSVKALGVPALNRPNVGSPATARGVAETPPKADIAPEGNRITPAFGVPRPGARPHLATPPAGVPRPALGVPRAATPAGATPGSAGAGGARRYQTPVGRPANVVRAGPVPASVNLAAMPPGPAHQLPKTFMGVAPPPGSLDLPRTYMGVAPPPPPTADFNRVPPPPPPIEPPRQAAPMTDSVVESLESLAPQDLLEDEDESTLPLLGSPAEAQPALAAAAVPQVTGAAVAPRRGHMPTLLGPAFAQAVAQAVPSAGASQPDLAGARPPAHSNPSEAQAGRVSDPGPMAPAVESGGVRAATLLDPVAEREPVTQDWTLAKTQLGAPVPQAVLEARTSSPELARTAIGGPPQLPPAAPDSAEDTAPFAAARASAPELAQTMLSAASALPAEGAEHAASPAPQPAPELAPTAWGSPPMMAPLPMLAPAAAPALPEEDPEVTARMRPELPSTGVGGEVTTAGFASDATVLGGGLGVLRRTPRSKLVAGLAIGTLVACAPLGIFAVARLALPTQASERTPVASPEKAQNAAAKPAKLTPSSAVAKAAGKQQAAPKNTAATPPKAAQPATAEPAAAPEAAQAPEPAAAAAPEGPGSSVGVGDVPWQDRPSVDTGTCESLAGERPPGPTGYLLGKAAKKAQMELIRGNTKGAHAAFCEAIQLGEPTSNILMGLARVLLMQSDLTRALETVERVLARTPDSTQALELKGDILIRGGRVDEAKQAWVKAAGASRASEMLVQNLIRANRKGAAQAMKAGDLSRAERMLRRAIAFEPEDPKTCQDLAAVLEKHGEAGAAKRWLAYAESLSA